MFIFSDAEDENEIDSEYTSYDSDDYKQTQQP